MTIFEFADKHHLNLEIVYRSHEMLGFSFRCAFNHCEIKTGGVLSATSGYGHSINQAISTYIAEIRGMKLVYKAMAGGNQRREFDVPYNLIAFEPESPNGSLIVAGTQVCARCGATLVEKISDALGILIRKCPKCGYCE
jgi:hypothetical protein